MMYTDDQLLRRSLITGHFEFAAGNHASEKIEFDRITEGRFAYFRKRRAAKSIARVVAREFEEVEAIATVANGANPLSVPVAKYVSKLLGRTVESYQTRKFGDDDKEFGLVGGNVHAANKRWVIVDDVFNKGTNTTKVANMLHRWGGTILGIGVFANRNAEGLDRIQYSQGSVMSCAVSPPEVLASEISVASVVDYPMEDYPKEVCLICPAPLTD
jgi:orotate phosphoribosyltransferase